MPGEIDIIKFFDEMMSKPEFLIPLVAAQYQYPHHYYGMTSAALLEDLFVDAALNFRNVHYHTTQLDRPEKDTGQESEDMKGQKGWDYRFDGQNYSHKVGQKTSPIALLWDATVLLPETKTYSYPSPIIYVLGNYEPKNSTLVTEDGSRSTISSSDNYRNKSVEAGQTVIVAARISGNSWKVLHSETADKKYETFPEFWSLNKVWSLMLGYWKEGYPANQIDIFIMNEFKKGTFKLPLEQKIDIHYQSLPGIYLFPFEKLQNVEVTKNNRGILLPSKTVRQFTSEALSDSKFVFQPTWYRTYAQRRTTDLFQAQKSEYEKLISSTNRH